jgi:hypothetical protein
MGDVAGPETESPMGVPEPPMAPVSIHAPPEAAFIHVEPPPAALHAEPAPKLEPRLADSAAPVERAESVPRNAPEIPQVSLELPPDSGLVLVETSHAAPPPVVDETREPRPHRVRAPRVKVAEEPLQLVETQHKEPPAA